jgi:hypothetical protein
MPHWAEEMRGATGAAQYRCGRRGNRAICGCAGAGRGGGGSSGRSRRVRLFHPAPTTGRPLFLQIRRDSEDQKLGSNCALSARINQLKSMFCPSDLNRVSKVLSISQKMLPRFWKEFNQSPIEKALFSELADFD